MDAEVLRALDARADQLIRNWSTIALFANLPPPPFDMMAVGTTFALMGSHLARLYGIETNAAMLKEMGSGVAGGVGSVLAGYYVATSLLKYIPGLNVGIALLIQPPVVGAVAFSVGHAFKQYYHAILLENHELTPTDFTEIAMSTLRKRLDLVGTIRRTDVEGAKDVAPSAVELIQNGAYEDRKAIVLVKNDKEGQEIKKKLVENRSPLVPLCLMPDETGNVTFQDGRPRPYVVYFGHPHKPSLYYPAASFHFQVFQDKTLELIRILRSLGATHYRIEHLRGLQADSVLEGELGVPTNLGKAGIKGEAEIRRKEEHALLWEERRKPSGKPQLPTDLVWYPNEPMWNALFEPQLKSRQKDIKFEYHYVNDFGINAVVASSLSMIHTKFFQLSLGGGFSDFQATRWKVKVTFA